MNKTFFALKIWKANSRIRSQLVSVCCAPTEKQLHWDEKAKVLFISCTFFAVDFCVPWPKLLRSLFARSYWMTFEDGRVHRSFVCVSIFNSLFRLTCRGWQNSKLTSTHNDSIFDATNENGKNWERNKRNMKSRTRKKTHEIHVPLECLPFFVDQFLPPSILFDERILKHSQNMLSLSFSLTRTQAHSISDVSTRLHFVACNLLLLKNYLHTPIWMGLFVSMRQNVGAVRVRL